MFLICNVLWVFFWSFNEFFFLGCFFWNFYFVVNFFCNCGILFILWSIIIVLKMVYFWFLNMCLSFFVIGWECLFWCGRFVLEIVWVVGVIERVEGSVVEDEDWFVRLFCKFCCWVVLVIMIRGKEVGVIGRMLL